MLDESAYGGRDPWYDRLTTLSEVEGVSSKILFFWIPDSRSATSGMTDLVLKPKIPSFSATLLESMLFR